MSRMFSVHGDRADIVVLIDLHSHDDPHSGSSPGLHSRALTGESLFVKPTTNLPFDGPVIPPVSWPAALDEPDVDVLYIGAPPPATGRPASSAQTYGRVPDPQPTGGSVSAGWGKRRAPISDEDRVEYDLRRARSLRELGEIESRRAVWAGHNAGLSQRQLGDLLGRSQPDIGRTLKKVEQDPSIVDPSPREFALRRAIGEYSGIEMMARLLTFSFTIGEADPSALGSGYLPGSWDQVRALRRERLITNDEWDQLFRANFGEQPGPGDLVLPESDEE